MDTKQVWIVFFLVSLTFTGIIAGYCPECICPVDYSPVCGKQKETGKLRGFTSLCLMECSNKCRKLQYEFFKTGRCGTKKRNPLAYFAESMAMVTPPSKRNTTEMNLTSNGL